MKSICRILFIILAVGSSNVCVADKADIVVVVNKNNPVSQISKSQLIDLYMGRYVAFPNGERAHPLDIDNDEPTKAQFYKQLIGMSLARVNSYWSRIRFTGRTKPPKGFLSERYAVEAVETDTRAIAYIKRENLNDNVKVVFTFDE